MKSFTADFTRSPVLVVDFLEGFDENLMLLPEWYH